MDKKIEYALSLFNDMAYRFRKFEEAELIINKYLATLTPEQKSIYLEEVKKRPITIKQYQSWLDRIFGAKDDTPSF